MVTVTTGTNGVMVLKTEFGGMSRAAMLHEANIILANIIYTFPQYREKLSGVNLLWSNRMKTSAGKAESKTCPKTFGKIKNIKLSWPIFKLEQNRHHFTETILHEIAHHMAGFNAGHGYAWQVVAKMIGCSAERCHNLEVELRPTRKRIPVRCTRCGAAWDMGPIKATRIERYSHKNCGGKIEKR